MKHTCETIQKNLVFFAESKYFQKTDMAKQEFAEIESHIATCSDCQQEVTAILHHIQLLQALRKPQPSRDLAAKCLWKIESHKRSFWKPVYTSGIILLLVFIFGIAFDRWYFDHSANKDPFYQLLTSQNLYITRLESLTKTKIQQPAQAMACIDYLKNTSNLIQKGYDENKNNYQLRQNFNQVIYQNILILQNLCNYVEKNTSIPAYDTWISQIEDGQTQKRI